MKSNFDPFPYIQSTWNFGNLNVSDDNIIIDKIGLIWLIHFPEFWDLWKRV